MPINNLLEIMSRLRDPINGCPWDVVQTFETIAPYTIEEAYEVREAISNNDYDNLKDELGDLLLQVVFQSQIAEELQNCFVLKTLSKVFAQKWLSGIRMSLGVQKLDRLMSSWRHGKISRQKSVRFNQRTRQIRVAL